MSEIVSRVFVISVLLFYAGLVVAFVLWSLGRWLRGSAKKRAWLAILEYVTRSRLFNRSYNAD
jgi:hypothetical protein